MQGIVDGGHEGRKGRDTKQKRKQMKVPALQELSLIGNMIFMHEKALKCYNNCK